MGNQFDLLIDIAERFQKWLIETSKELGMDVESLQEIIMGFLK